MADEIDDGINKAFDEYWRRLGSTMRRPDPKETDEEFRERSARCAFLIAASAFISPNEGDK